MDELVAADPAADPAPVLRLVKEPHCLRDDAGDNDSR